MEKQYHSIFKQIGKNRFYTACNATCSGRIKNGSEFFCGDGIVQYKGSDYSETKGCGTNGATCTQVTGNGSSQYPGPGFTGTFNTSEQCDPNDTKNEDNNKKRVNKLCNLLMGTNRSDYYEPDASRNITCSDSCTRSFTVYSGDTTNKSVCGYQGDGVIQRYTCLDANYNGITCYPTLKSSSDNEECDNAAGHTQSQLCQIKYGKYTYYSPSGLSCNSSGQVVGATKGSSSSTCRYCGDGVVSDSEKCDGNTTTCYKSNGTYSYDCDTWGNNCSTGTYYDYYNVSCSSCNWSLGSAYSTGNKFNSGTPSMSSCASLGL